MENSFLNLASTRRSIRKYEESDVPLEDIEYFIRAAVQAPSGCNSQCWKFIAIKDREIINRISESVIRKVESILEIKGDELSQEYLSSKRKAVSFFSKAPVIIAAFMTGIQHYDPTFMSALRDRGYTEDDIMKLYGHYDVLSMGAAIQNMLLAVHEKGYGACWMNDPTLAGEELNEILKVPSDHKFISLIPIGFPAYVPRNKKMKEFSEVFSIL